MTKNLKTRQAVVRGMHRMAAIAAGAVMVFGTTSPAHADDAANTNPDWSKIFTFSGFGTAGVTHSSLGAADYTDNLFQPKGAGASSRYSFTNTTKMGAQVNAQFTNQLSAVVQLITQEDYNNSYAPTVEWANIKYAFTPDLSIRAGRIALPSFLSADYRNVGYANPWVNAPAEVYNLLPITNSDGVDASYKVHFSNFYNTVQALYGSNNTHVPGPIKVAVKDLFGVFDTVEKGALTARVGYEQGNVTLGPFPTQSLRFYNIGAGYDPGDWFVQSEWARATVGHVIPGYSSWYLMGGYRIQKFTPYVMVSNEKSLHDTTFYPSARQGQKDHSVGVRWDFYKNADLKVQYDHVTLPGNAAGYFINPQKNFSLGSSANVISAVLDFVF